METLIPILICFFTVIGIVCSIVATFNAAVSPTKTYRRFQSWRKRRNARAVVGLRKQIKDLQAQLKAEAKLSATIDGQRKYWADQYFSLREILRKAI